LATGKIVKQGRDGASWQRDLRQDLRHLQAHHGVRLLVCLLNLSELRSLQIGELEKECAKQGLPLLQYPIVEMAAPTDLATAAELVASMCEHYREGTRIVIHCRGGVGRAGMMAAACLLRLEVGASPKEAIAIVRRRRCSNAVESHRQEAFVTAFHRLSHQEEGVEAMPLRNLHV